MLDLSAFLRGRCITIGSAASGAGSWTSGSNATASLDRMAEYLQVSTATETREQAEELARGATAARLVAGAQIVGPVISVFWHLGEFGQGEEWQVIFKTTWDRYLELEAHLSDNHPWNNPEIVAIPILAGSGGYLEWVSRTTARHDQID